MKTDSPGERRESRSWCQEILRVMNWNLLIRGWKIQTEPDPLQEHFRRMGEGVRGYQCHLYVPGRWVCLKPRKPGHPVWEHERLDYSGIAEPGDTRGQDCRVGGNRQWKQAWIKRKCRSEPCAPQDSAQFFATGILSQSRSKNLDPIKTLCR